MKNILFSIILLSLTLPAKAQSIENVLKDIENNNISLKAINAEITAAVHDIRSENNLDAPSVEYSPFFRKGESGVASSELVVSQEFDFPTLYAARSKSGQFRKDILDSEQYTSRRDILLAAKQKCLELILLQQQGEILAERKIVSDELLKLYAERFDRGDATILDLNRVKIECMELDAAIAENSSAIARVNSELTAMNGNIAPDTKGIEYPVVPLSLISEENLTALVENDAALRTAEASVASARQDVKISRQGWLPKISLGYRRNTELNEASNGFLVGLSLPVFSTGNKVKAADSRLLASQLNKDETKAKIESEVSANIAELKNLHKVMGIYDMSLMQETLELLKKSVELGNMTITEYYMETDKIYTKIQDYLNIENRFQLLAADLLKNEL